MTLDRGSTRCTQGMYREVYTEGVPRSGVRAVLEPVLGPSQQFYYFMFMLFLRFMFPPKVYYFMFYVNQARRAVQRPAVKHTQTSLRSV